ncbi:MAG: hypothetical protein ACTTKO_00390 [Candidatus Limimorpha sp.]
MKKWIPIVVAASLLLFCACRKRVEYLTGPQISYGGFQYIIGEDSSFTGEGILSLGYTDGDGDLGLDESDSIFPFGPMDAHYYNLIIDYRKYQHGDFVSTPLLSWNAVTQSYDTITFNARFKRLLDTEESKPISGTIEYKMLIQNPLSQGDTIRFAVKIFDRALHESNTVITETIYTNPSLQTHPSSLQPIIFPNSEIINPQIYQSINQHLYKSSHP